MPIIYIEDKKMNKVYQIITSIKLAPTSKAYKKAIAKSQGMLTGNPDIYQTTGKFVDKKSSMKGTNNMTMKVSNLEFTTEMSENAWRGHRVEMPKTDAQRYVSSVESAAKFIESFGDVEIVKDEYYGHYAVPAFAEGRKEYSKLKGEVLASWGNSGG